jgi:hypothetical protein
VSLFIEKEFIPGILRFHESQSPEVPECEGEIGTPKPKEFADAIERHWKTVDRHQGH